MAWVRAPIVLGFASVFAFAPPAPVTAAAVCSNDVFAIEGVPVAVELCAQPGARRGEKAAPVTLTETLSVRGQPPYVRQLPLEVVGGTEASRTIDDVPLSKLGIPKTLHVTIAYRAGSVRLEHALLVPGAISLK